MKKRLKRRNPYAAALRNGAFKKRVVPSRRRKPKREGNKLRRSLREYSDRRSP